MIDRRRIRPRRLFGPLLLSAAGLALAQSGFGECGNVFAGEQPPLDYRTAGAKEKHEVESFHFTPQVETLIRGQSSPLGSDIDYTLRHIPNHHRALLSMTKLGERFKTPRPPYSGFTVECYFSRAIRFRPDDNIVRMLYAKYLIGQGRKDDAIAQLEVADSQSGDNGFSQYNIGLIYFEMDRPDQALVHAQKALALGFQRPDLKDKLVQSGKWADPPPLAASAPDPGASAAAEKSN